MKKAIFAALAVVAMASCTKQDSFEGSTTEAQELKFTSGIVSRVSGNKWEFRDRVGISLSGVNVYYDNIPYSAINSGASTDFEPVSANNAIYTQRSEEYPARISAYYPYIDGNRYFNIEDQSNLSAVDYMEAEQVTITEATTSVALNFVHKHTLVKLKIRKAASIASLEGLTFELQNVQIAGICGSSVDAEMGSITNANIDIASDGMSAEIAMILFPTVDNKPLNAKLSFTLNGETYTTDFITTLVPSMQQSYAMTIGNDEIIIEGSTITEWGTSDTTSDDIIAEEFPDGILTFDQFVNLTAEELPIGDEWTINGGDSYEEAEMLLDGAVAQKICTMIDYPNRSVVLSFTNLKIIKYKAFMACAGFTTIMAPQVTEVQSNAFLSNKSLVNVFLPHASTFGLGAFEACPKLETVLIPSLTTLPRSIFWDCPNLKKLAFSCTKDAVISSLYEESFGGSYEKAQLDQVDLFIGPSNAHLVNGNTLTVGDVSLTFKSITLLEM